MLGVGMLSEVLLNILRPILGRGLTRILFGTKGVTPLVAIVVLVLAVGLTIWWRSGGKVRYEARQAAMSDSQKTQTRRGLIIGGVVLLLILPLILGTYLTEVVDNVGLFILMGLGLNIVVGFAGLLDLGYVAFFAIGAYVVGILTSSGDLGILNLSFWLALPIAVLVAVMAGMTLGIPVLRMRGDYLAIVTLGFGEIIRVLATSDLLKPYIGGAQGVLQIAKPEIFGFTMVQPQHFYYLILAGVGLAILVSFRLRDARLGRQWMAMREDEDVAEAMGIHLVSTKLLAFGIGAGFSGLAGAIFAARLSSIFPHSFNLLISINVLSLIIVGGMGSLPGVVVGALVLVGLPELLREFAEYRMLLYGALLIAMMVTRPEGLWPSPITQRELHAEEELEKIGGPVSEAVPEARS
jgi:branched-chain amino acid transport system permease protein